jgi:alkylation response protein AidB-like acyl-CoA dehydrogenase
LKVPASRIIGGYTVKDGVIVPRYNHGEIIEAVFRRTRVTVGIMTAAKLLSAVEPVVRYQRGRFRGGESVAPGSPRYELGLQQREDVLHRLVDVWATGEAGASLGFAAARLFDELDPLEQQKDEIFEKQAVGGSWRSPPPRLACGTRGGLARCNPIRWCGFSCWTPWGMSCARRASCGTRGTGPP